MVGWFIVGTLAIMGTTLIILDRHGSISDKLNKNRRKRNDAAVKANEILNLQSELIEQLLEDCLFQSDRIGVLISSAKNALSDVDGLIPIGKGKQDEVGLRALSRVQTMLRKEVQFYSSRENEAIKLLSDIQQALDHCRTAKELATKEISVTPSVIRWRSITLAVFIFAVVMLMWNVGVITTISSDRSIFSEGFIEPDLDDAEIDSYDSINEVNTEESFSYDKLNLEDSGETLFDRPRIALPMIEESEEEEEEKEFRLVINYDENLAEIKEDYLESLSQISSELLENESITVIVEGHQNAGETCSSDEFTNIAEERLLGIIEVLLENGVDVNRIEGENLEDRKPLDGISEEEISLNQRVEIYYVYEKEPLIVFE